MFRNTRRADLWHSLLRYAAILCATFYGLWNLAFLIQAKIPPSILTGLTGLPSPTTGGTRSMQLLWRGHFRESLQANLFAVPITLCFVFTLGLLVAQRMRHRKLSVPSWLVTTWGLLLLIAWLAKLIGDRTYW